MGPLGEISSLHVFVPIHNSACISLGIFISGVNALKVMDCKNCPISVAEKL